MEGARGPEAEGCGWDPGGSGAGGVEAGAGLENEKDERARGGIRGRRSGRTI